MNNLFSALAPLLTGLILAWLLHPAVDWLKPRTGCRTAILITYLALFLSLTALVSGFLFLILGALPSGGFQDTVSLVLAYFQDGYDDAASLLNRWFPAKFADSGTAVRQLQSWISRQFSIQSLSALLTGITSAAVTLFFGIVASVYLLKDADYFLMLRDRILALFLPQRVHGVCSELLYEINQVLSAFLKGAFFDSLLIAFLSSAALSVLRVDYAVIIGMFAGVLNIIPYFGPFIGMIPAFLTALLTGGPIRAAAAVLALFLIQQADSNYIYPRIVGRSTGLHPLFVLLAVSFFGSFFGLPGILLAVPAAGVLQVLIRFWVYR